MKMTGHTILVTGSTSGIGRALAEALHARGNQVIIAGRRQDQLDAVTHAHPGIAALRLDVADPASVAAAADEVTRRFPGIDTVIANAGISRGEHVADDGWDLADAEAMVETNILGVLRTVGAFLPILKRQPSATIIATSSNLAFVPLASHPTYCATKAFVHSWLQSLRHQLRHLPIEVLELAPPYVQTELTGAHQLSDPHAMPLAAFVSEVMELLEQGHLPAGEISVGYGHDRRTAEREGRYAEMFATMNPD